jgi:hypothetical protein
MTTTNDFFTEDFDLSEEDRTLMRLYGDIGRSVDELAYTDDFDLLYQRYLDAGYSARKHEVFRRLLTLRKAGLLPRLFKHTA